MGARGETLARRHQPIHEALDRLVTTGERQLAPTKKYLIDAFFA
jgi:hypothetical protein